MTTRTETINTTAGEARPYAFPRLLDLLVSGFGLLLLSPLFLLLSILIRLTSFGPAFYRSERIGTNGSAFLLYKFRSMTVCAPQSGSGITRSGDARITPVGKLLRKFKLDELPQLINVWKGEMSLVGPRPEDPRFVRRYPDQLRDILRYKPGITSPASLHFRNESALLTSDDHERQYIDEILPVKLTIDLEYFSRSSLRTDVGLIFKTVLQVFRK